MLPLRGLLAFLAVLLFAPTVGAQSPGAKTTLKIVAKARTNGPAVEHVANGRNSSLSPDGEYVVWADRGAVYARSTRKSGKARKLADTSALQYAITPDSRYVLIPGAPMRRVALGKNSPAVPLEVTGGKSLIASNSHVAFLNAGKLFIADLLKGTAVPIDIDPPTSGQCHRGDGVPRALSPDGKWFVFQHGCDAEYIVGTNGKGLRKLPFISAIFVGTHLFGSPKTDAGMTPAVTVLDPSNNEQWTIPDIAYSPFRKAVPGKLAFIQVVGGELQHVDLRTTKTKTVEAGPGDVVGFISTSPDGVHAFYSVYESDKCSVYRVELPSGTKTRLAKVKGGQQCFVRPLGNDHAAAYFWRSEPTQAIAARVDLKTGKLERLGDTMPQIGSLHAAGPTLLLSTRDGLAISRLPEK